MKNNVVLLLGSNEGDRLANLNKAIHYLNESVGDILSRSAIYETAPWGNADQPPFYNQVIFINSHLEASELMQEIIHIEEGMGRRRVEKWEKRVIDLDILFFNNDIIDSENLTVPHPRLHLRKFTLVPLAEILPGYVHPLLKLSSRELLTNCNDKLSVTRVRL